MIKNRHRGFVAIDAIISIIAIMIFSTLILSLMYNNAMENLKLKKETLAMIYITETFENIGRENYDNVTIENIDNLVPKDALENYEVEMDITTDLDNCKNNENILKKIQNKMSYSINSRTYSYIMERMKIKE